MKTAAVDSSWVYVPLIHLQFFCWFRNKLTVRLEIRHTSFTFKLVYKTFNVLNHFIDHVEDGRNKEQQLNDEELVTK
jgi:hypothetical protein